MNAGANFDTLPSIMDMPPGREVELAAIDLPDAELEALFERGIMPGCTLSLVRRSPFGDPVIRFEGTVLALRRETAARLKVRPRDPEHA